MPLSLWINYETNPRLFIKMRYHFSIRFFFSLSSSQLTNDKKKIIETFGLMILRFT